jgi:hypothetical protein
MAGAAACSSGGGSPPDASRDGVVYDLALDLPVGCPPDAGNTLGVGAHCTRGGNECVKSGMPSGLVCACDTIDGVTLIGVPCICTRAGLNTSASSQDPCGTVQPACGAGATCCNYMSIAYYCSPDVCLPGGACIDFSAPASN